MFSVRGEKMFESRVHEGEILMRLTNSGFVGELAYQLDNRMSSGASGAKVLLLLLFLKFPPG